MGCSHFLNLTCDIEESKRQRHVTLAFLKLICDIGDPPSPLRVSYFLAKLPTKRTRRTPWGRTLLLQEFMVGGVTNTQNRKNNKTVLKSKLTLYYFKMLNVLAIVCPSIETIISLFDKSNLIYLYFLVKLPTKRTGR